ncbi:MAG TPA: 1-acyl-sn-glycerol-3-phosphate acyltransferase [Alphaproteobacteria bacterium]|nr:1-acyl-sn-glycerol-3-phosphate acyltransferase [Alphaproteobacteria bacterium]HAJ48607.1 1-acyl-sn-glycerol-3-phosphate acyltransferase [Alphaproteobacteria bacterium]
MRAIRGFGCLLGFLLITLAVMPVQWLAIRYNWALKDTLPIRYHRMVCRLIGIRIETFGKPVQDRGVFLAANHTSYLDIPILAAVIPVCYVAKADVGRWPLFGTLARLSRTVFVERERRSRTAAQRDVIRERLEEGGTIVLFAEGTSSDGNRVLEFKSALLSAADGTVRLPDGSERRIIVQPVSVAYTRLHGMPMGREYRPFFAWYGDMDLVPHLWEAFCLGPIDVVVHYHPPLTVDQFGGSRKALALQCQKLVAEGVAHALAGRPGAVGPAYNDDKTHIAAVERAAAEAA